MQRNREALIVMVEPTPGMRGPQRTLLALARLAARHHDVRVAVPEGYVSRALREEGSKIGIIPLPFHSSRAGSWAGGARSLLKALEGERREILIHANGLSALNLVAPVARRRDAPVLVHFHANEILMRSRLYLQVWRRLGVRMSFYAVSEFGRGLLEGTSIRPLVRGVLPNPVDCVAYRVERDGPRRPFRVGYVGGRAPRKGLHLLIRIAELLREENVEWFLYGIDPGMRTAYLERCREEVERRGLADRVRWLGKTDDPPSAYSSVDALLVPSRRESFPRVALEALASGLPVIATRVTGLSEVISDGVDGLLFDPKRPEDGAEHLRAVIQDQALRQRLMLGALQRASGFDTPRIGHQLEGLYAELLGGGGKTSSDGEA